MVSSTTQEISYSDKLKDPQWQRKRLEILQRDGWKCRNCGETKATLVVHHRIYLKGHEPWDYPDWSLVTICQDCHDEERRMLASLPNLFSMLQCNLWSVDIESLVISTAVRGPRDYEDLSVALACWVIEHPELQSAILKALEPLMSPRMAKLYTDKLRERQYAE